MKQTTPQPVKRTPKSKKESRPKYDFGRWCAWACGVAVLCSLSGCVTTTSTAPDGTVTKTTRQDPKVIKAVQTGIGIGVQAGVNAAIQQMQNQQGK